MDEGTWVRATVVRPGELGEPELARWRDFQAAQLELANPFLTAGFARAVDQVSDRARVAVFEDGSTIVGFLPFELRVRGVGTAIGRKLNTRQGLVHESGLPWSWSQVLDATSLDVLELSDLVGSQTDPRSSLEMRRRAGHRHGRRVGRLPGAHQEEQERQDDPLQGTQASA